MARQEGFEPPTYCLEGSCSILLSYWRVYADRANKIGKHNVACFFRRWSG